MVDAGGTEVACPIYIPQQGEEPEFVKLDGESLPSNVYDVVQLLKVETATRDRWLAVACAYDRCGMRENCIKILEEATSEQVEAILSASESRDDGSRISMLGALAGAYVMAAANEAAEVGVRSDYLKKASEVLAKAEKIDFDHPVVLAGKGWREFVAGNGSLSEQWFENARANSAKVESSLSGRLGLAAIQLNHPDAKPNDTIRLLKVALRHTCCPPGAWVGLGHAYFRAGDDEMARRVLRRAVVATDKASNPEKLEALVALARAEATSSHPDAASNTLAALMYGYSQCGGDNDPRILSHLAEIFYFGGNGVLSKMFARRASTLAHQVPSYTLGSSFAAYPSALKAVSLFQHARAQHLLGNYVEAEQLYVRSIDLADSEAGTRCPPAALLKLGLLRLASGKYKRAAECLEKLLKICPDCAIASRALGVIVARNPKIGSRERARASELLKKGIEADPEGLKDIPALLCWAKLLTLEFPEKALKMYHHALEAAKQEHSTLPFSVFNNIAALEARLGRLEDAEKRIQRLKEDIEDPTITLTVLFNEARLAEMSNRSAEAKEMYKNILQRCPEYLDAKVRLGCILLAEGDKKGAEEAFDAGLKSSSLATREAASCYKADLLRKTDRDEELQRLIEPQAMKSGFGALAMAQFLYERLGNVAEERKPRMLSWIANHLSAALKRMPSNAYAANGVGVFLAEEKNMADARDAFAASGACGSVAKVNLAHAQVELGRRTKMKPPNIALLDQAAKLYGDALKEGSGNEAYILLCHARANFEAAKYREAAASLRKALELRPLSQGIMFNLALALEESALAHSSMRHRTLTEMRAVEKEFEDARGLFMKLERLKYPIKDRFVNERINPKLAFHHSRYLHQKLRTHKVFVLNIEAEEEELMKERRKKEEQRAERERKARRERELQAQREAQRREALEIAAREAAEKLKQSREAMLNDRKKSSDEEELEEGARNQALSSSKRQRKRRRLVNSRSVSRDDESSDEYGSDDYGVDEADERVKKRGRFGIASDDESNGEENEKRISEVEADENDVRIMKKRVIPVEEEENAES